MSTALVLGIIGVVIFIIVLVVGVVIGVVYYLHRTKEKPSSSSNPNSNPGPATNLTSFIYEVTLASPYKYTIGLAAPTSVKPYRYSFDIEWGDGQTTKSVTSYNDPRLTHTYKSSGPYKLILTGTINGFTTAQFNATSVPITNVLQFGDVRFAPNGLSYIAASKIDATDSPSFFNNDAAYFLQKCENLASIASIGSWDMSQIVSIDGFFMQASVFNGDISGWDTSSVTNMNNVFNGATEFNQDISGWNTSNVTKFSFMFNNAINFNQDISGWNTSKVTNFNSMFMGASSFNQDIGNWDMSSCETMVAMFAGATSFNGNIDLLLVLVNNVANMAYMFANATAFNRDISKWKVDNVTNMTGMFSGATLFNKDISEWNVGKVTSFQNFCTGATAFFAANLDDTCGDAWKGSPSNNHPFGDYLKGLD